MVCCSQMSKGACVWTKRKSPQTLPLIPMKSLTVWRGHSTRPSLPVGTARRASGSLPRGRRNRLIMQTTKNRKFPLGRFCPAERRARGTGCSNPLFYCSIKSMQNKKSSTPQGAALGATGRIRTSGLPGRSRTLYPAELRSLIYEKRRSDVFQSCKVVNFQ